jgi:hypothetical protein
MHTAEDYNIGLGFSSLLAQFQGIAGKIGDILDFGPLVIMDKDDGVFLLLESSYFVDDFRIFSEHKRLDSVGLV